jgi:hypothetical protein
MSEREKESGPNALPQEPPPPPPEELVDADDAVIGRAFRRSLVAALCGALLLIVALVAVRRPHPALGIEEAVVQSPQARNAGEMPGPPTVRFTDVTTAAGIAFVQSNGAYGESLLPETMGGGVAFFDYDGDGDEDLLLVNSGTWPWREEAHPRGAALYRNRGDGIFDDVTAGSGLEASAYGMGVAVGDYDGDGRVDVLLTALGPSRLFRNLGDGRFEDVTAEAGVGGAADAWNTSAAFFDYDRDGDLDLFVTSYVRWSRDIDREVDYRLAGIGRAYGPPANYEGTSSHLYRNDGASGFTDVSDAAGIVVTNPATGTPMGKGLGVLPIDVDDDGWLDLVIANDTVRKFLFHNRGDGTFEEVGVARGIAYDNAGAATGAMGIDGARFRNDAALGIAMGNFANEMTSFYVADDRAAVFSDDAIVEGIGPDSRRVLTFGLFFFDYDLDGWLDLFQANGHVEDEINVVQASQQYAQPAQIYWNCHCSRGFVTVAQAGLGDLAAPAVGRGAAYADVDRDGDLDLIVTQVGRAAHLFRNGQQLGHHWLRLRLRGTAMNKDAIGARVRIRTGGGVQERTVMPSRSYLSQVELPLTFGLGTATSVDSIEIRWPDGKVEVLSGVPVDSVREVREEK